MKWVKLDKVTSTNSYIGDLIRNGEVHKEMIVIADNQVYGRGQGDHSWHSRPGENLLMSMLFYPEFLSASNQFRLSMMVSLAICDLLVTEGVDPFIKWPNDILTGQGKIAGILIEHGITGNKISHTIVGIGLNLNQNEFPDFPVPATSLALETGKHLDPGEVAERLSGSIMTLYDKERISGTEGLERDYLERLYMMNRTAVFRAGGSVFRGVVRGVNGYGELLVETDRKIRAFGTHEISMDLSTPLKDR